MEILKKVNANRFPYIYAFWRLGNLVSDVQREVFMEARREA